MKISRLFVTVLVGATVALAGISYFMTSARSGGNFEKLFIESKNGRHTLEIEVAATPVDLEIGLMFREHMESDHGMLFELGRTAITRFWMKNTLIPLDMLFIAPDGTIKKIHESAEPNSLTGVSSDVPVSAVLELNGGRARALGIAEGDKVIHPYFSGLQQSPPEAAPAAPSQ